jgi:hypothetical protein
MELDFEVLGVLSDDVGGTALMAVETIAVHTCDRCGVRVESDDPSPMGCGFQPRALGPGWMKDAERRRIIFYAWDLCFDCRTTMTVEEFRVWGMNEGKAAIAGG